MTRPQQPGQPLESSTALREVLRPVTTDENYRARLRNAFDDNALHWVDTVVNTAWHCAERWGLTLYSPYLPVSFNIVLPASGPRGEALALKLCPPTAPELSTEIAILLLRPARTIELVAADPSAGAMLLSRVTPGTNLAQLARDDDRAATEAAAELIAEFPVAPASHVAFETTLHWGRGLLRVAASRQRFDASLPHALVGRAATLYQELTDADPCHYVLHGDLHHFNILCDQDAGWLAVDPKGVVGPRAYEVGALLRNPGPELARWPNLLTVMRDRIAILSERLGVDRATIWGWGFSQAVMAAVWADEDGDDEWRAYASSIAETLCRAEPESPAALTAKSRDADDALEGGSP
jgi:streptomycin 6-kinase